MKFFQTLLINFVNNLKESKNFYKQNLQLKRVTFGTATIGGIFLGLNVVTPPTPTVFSISLLNNIQDTFSDNIGGVVRFLRSISIGMTISIDYYFSMMGLEKTCPNYQIMMSKIHQRAANRILKGCLINGGSYIKLGQGLVSMSHILPKEYIDTLKVLQDKCLTRKPDEIMKIFLEDFGKSPNDIFKCFNFNPIAAASLAQVFKACTRNNEIVAVKIQYIDLQNRFKYDCSIIYLLLKMIGFMHKDFNFSWIVNDLVNTLAEELDFKNEGRNAEQCAKEMKQFKYIYVPKIYWEYTTTRILVMEYIDGIKISDINQLKKNKFSLTDINKKLFEAFGHQIFQTGFVHADPHPGNILVRKFNNSAQLIILDHGLYQKISDDIRIALSYMWKSIVLNNHENMKKYSQILGVEDYKTFAEILTQTPLRSHNFKLKNHLTEEDLQKITEVARTKFDTIMNCLQTMPRELLLVIRNLNTIRAIAHDHGNPIDKYTVLSRKATQIAFSGKLIDNVINIPTKIYFELKLLSHKIQRWLKDTILKYLIYFRLAPDIKQIISNVVNYN